MCLPAFMGVPGACGGQRPEDVVSSPGTEVSDDYKLAHAGEPIQNPPQRTKG